MPAIAQVKPYPVNPNHGNHASYASLTISADRHQRFWLFVDDVLQNEDPVRSICVRNMENKTYYIRVELDNALHHCVGQYVDLHRYQSLEIEQEDGFYGLEYTHDPIRPELTMDLLVATAPLPSIAPMPPVAHGMNPYSYDEAVRMISDETFDDSKLTIAKQIVSSNPMSANQIANICKLFSFESNKLEFAKYAYSYCVDKNNYFLLNGVFTYDSSKRELNDYIH